MRIDFWYHPMMRAALVVALVMFGSHGVASAQAADASQMHESERGPIVLMIDPGPLRISADRLGHAIAHVLARDVVRLVDPRAREARHVLAIAYDTERRWHVRLESGGKSITMIENAVPPGAIDDRLADACRRAMSAMRELERTEELPVEVPVDRVWNVFSRSRAQEILDPFVDVPHREVAILSEVIDPFAPVAARRSVLTEVLDPWGY